MPSGKVHTNVTVASALAMAVSGVGNEYVIGAVAGVWLSPDLDVDAGYIGYRMLPQPLRFVWYLLWSPYRKLIKHRSWISHFPLISTAIRIAYLSAFVYPIVLAMEFPMVYQPWMAGVFLGLAAVDTLHYLMDIAWRQSERFR